MNKKQTKQKNNISDEIFIFLTTLKASKQA